MAETPRARPGPLEPEVPFSNGLAAAFEAVRRTHASHDAALVALERAFASEKVAADARLQVDIASARRLLDDDRAAFARDVAAKGAADEEATLEAARLRAAALPPDATFELNVGGVRFETSRAALAKVGDSLLGRMFGAGEVAKKADDGASIFIDRDGRRFAYVLDFLRDLDAKRAQRGIRALPEAEQRLVVAELDYFGLEAAVFGTRPWCDHAAFRAGPPMGSKRYGCAASLAGGRVIVFGGHSGVVNLNSTEVLDAGPSAAESGAFAPGPKLLMARLGCAAVQLDADRVLVVGGLGGEQRLNTTEILHLSTHLLEPGPEMLSGRYQFAAALVDSRTVIVFGGFRGGSYLSCTEVLSLDTMAFAPGPAMGTPRRGCAAVALGAHRILVVGGYNLDGGHLRSTQVLDVRSMTFSDGPTMHAARWGCAAVAVDAQHVLVVGGREASGAPLATTELLDLETMEFEPGPTMLVGRYECAATRLDTAEERRILVVGGQALAPADDAKNDGGDDGGVIYLSTTEVLAVGPPAARPRQ